MLTVTDLNKLSLNDLVKLNKMVVATIKTKQRVDNSTAIYQFSSGDEVKFTASKLGYTITGKVLQVKRTKVVVDCGARGRYLVPASMLSKGV